MSKKFIVLWLHLKYISKMAHLIICNPGLNEVIDDVCNQESFEINLFFIMRVRLVAWYIEPLTMPKWRAFGSIRAMQICNVCIWLKTATIVHILIF